MSLTCAAQLRLLVRVTPSRRVSYMTSRGSQLGEKIILFGEVEGENLCLLKIDFHQIPVGKLEEVTQLVLENGQVRGEGEAR